MPVNYFPNALRYNNLQFASNVLLHIRNSVELKEQVGTTGEKVLPLLSQFRSVKDDYIDEYYEILTAICTHLIKFSSLCESCSKSGAYAAKRQAQLNVVLKTISDLEAEADIIKFLENMRRRPTVTVA